MAVEHSSHSTGVSAFPAFHKLPVHSTVELVGPGGSFIMTEKMWQSVLRLARVFGWQPRTALALGAPAPSRDGDGSGRRVADEDARALSAVLEEAFDRLPDDGGLPGLPELSPFRGDNKPWLRNLAAYCRAGGFYVW